ncbi:helix-turn-helix domain-containing protein [Streptomyces sp. NPDC000658]|uniref:helix-turn-helix domain-containing protein n=1 Tax=Streptomyces sp. NPDC000658 TaxID=3154266 RepID=UPI00331B9512
MRYPQGGGLTPERQAFRERIRLEAAERFAAGASNAEVAKDLRVSVHSVQRWRRAWHKAGTEGLHSAGPVSPPRLSEALFCVLEQKLAKGPVAHGWPDRTWTLARIKTLIGRRFHKSMTRPSRPKRGCRCGVRAAAGLAAHRRLCPLWRRVGRETGSVLPLARISVTLACIIHLHWWCTKLTACRPRPLAGVGRREGRYEPGAAGRLGPSLESE